MVSELGKMNDDVERIIREDNLVSWDAAKITGDILLRFKGLNLNSAYNIYEGIAGMIKDGVEANDVMTLLNMPKTEKRAFAAKIREGESLADYAGRVAKAYNNEKMFQRYAGQYIDKYYFHDGDNDMTEFNRVLEKAKRWDKLRKEKSDSEEFRELNENGRDWKDLLEYAGAVKNTGKAIMTGDPAAVKFSESPRFAKEINRAKEIVEKYEPEYGRDD
jgi:hypothetical protein